MNVIGSGVAQHRGETSVEINEPESGRMVVLVSDSVELNNVLVHETVVESGEVIQGIITLGECKFCDRGNATQGLKTTHHDSLHSQSIDTHQILTCLIHH